MPKVQLKRAEKIPKLNKPSNKISMIRINGPLIENFSLKLSYLSGNRLNNTLEPSSGGMGIKLKTIKITLTKTSKNKKLTSIFCGPKIGETKFKIRPKIIAPNKLERGPAKDTKPLEILL